MANQLYNYKAPPSYVAGATSRSEASNYLSVGSIATEYSTTELLASSSAMRNNLHHNYSVTRVQPYVPPRVDGGAAVASSAEPLYASLKRNLSESLYHQTILGAYSKVGQNEAWYPSDPLAKRTRYESTSHLLIYPQRPGEKECAFYMQTRTCKFGESCKFHHPIQVPEGGIPDWKEGPSVGIAATSSTSSSLPERPSEPPCAFYMKTGKCKYGASCKFHHPKEVQIQLSLAGSESQPHVDKLGVKKPAQPSLTPSVSYNSKGLPIRMGEEDCPFYLKAGSCKYGATCRFSHPETSYLSINVNPVAAAIGSSSTLLPSPSLSAYYNPSVGSSAASLLSTYNPRPAQSTLGLGHTVYPQRPGQPPCDYYMKHGTCKFGANCKFHHPIDRSAPIPSIKEAAPQQQNNVKLTLAGLPRREGAINCPYYMKTGTCKFGSTCKFDHPTPGEVLALAATISNAATAAESEQHDDQSA